METMKGHAAVTRHMHHFTVDHRARNFQTGERSAKRLETVAPIVRRAREESGVPVRDHGEEPIAIELDFVNPAFAAGRRISRPS